MGRGEVGDELEPCDCLNFCGDDHWLEKGKARPCEAKVKRDAELQAFIAGERRKAELLQLLGHGSVLEALEELARLRAGGH